MFYLALGLQRPGIPGPAVDALVRPTVPFDQLHTNSEARDVGGVAIRIASIDFSYSISEERLRAYASVPDIERLRWLDELVRFTMMWRAAAPGNGVSAVTIDCDSEICRSDPVS
jgi:hypothetical protein